MPKFIYRNEPEDVSFSCNLVCDRCTGTTKTGGRCRRRTCRYLPMCFQHLKSELGLKVAPSTIPGAGDGLFTTRPRKRGDKIVEYRGELLDGPEVDERYGLDATAPYALELSANDPIIDSACERWTAAYINHKGISQANCRFSRGQDGRAWVVATKAIPPDRELTVSYGRDYRFTEPGVTHRTKR